MEATLKKTFGILFAIVMLLGLASATLTTSTIPELSQSSGSFKVNVTSTENESVSISIPSIIQGSNEITFSGFPSTIILNDLNGRKVEITVNYDVPSGFVFELGQTYSTNLDLNGSLSGAFSAPISFKEGDFCEGVENNGNLEIRDLEFDVENGYGDSDDFWYLFDTISVDIEVRNDGSWDTRNVQLEWELYNTAGDRITDGDVNDFDLDEGDENTVTISFKLDEDIKDFEGENAVLFVRATGEIDDSQSQYDGDDTCASDSREVEVRTGDEFMIVEDMTINGNPAERSDVFSGSITCGSTVDFTGVAYNIGDRDQENPFVVAYSNDLGVNEIINLNDVNAFRSEDFSLRFDIPKDAEEKTYTLSLSVYDDNSRIFENDEDDDSITNVYFKVEGNCAITPPTVTAEISSGEAKEGKDVTIQAYLRNENNEETTYVLSAEGYSSWANLKEFEPQTFTLGPGEAKDILITLSLKQGSEGEREFNLVASSNGQVLLTKPVLLSVESGSFWDDLGTQNWDWKLIGIIALNVVLLVLIIVVAAKVLKRR
ncbi:MAG: putative S-layer protein [archaeon]|nr:putative S-layer protein [archaeon]